MEKFLLVLILFLFIGCSDESDSIYSYNIPKNCKPDIETGEIVVIDNQADFNKAFSNIESDLKSINFKKSKLIVVHDVSNKGISELAHSFIKDEDNCLFTVNISQNYTSVMEPWCVAYVVPTSMDISHLRLIIEYTEI